MANPQPVGLLRRAATDDPSAPRDQHALWRLAAQVATIGIFVLLFIAFLDLARPFLLPVTAAAVGATLLHPLTRRARRWGIPPALSALLFVAVLLAVCYFGLLLLSDPISDAVKRAPQFAATIGGKLHKLEANFALLRYFQSATPGSANGAPSVDIASFIKPVLGFLTPALGELLVFFTTLFLLMVGYDNVRRNFILMFRHQDSRLEVIRIFNHIEQNLTRYLGTVTLINAGVGLIMTTFLFLLGFPNYALWGALAFVCNYVPYIGPGFMILVLFVAGLIVFPTVGYALLAPAFVLCLTTLEGHFVTPNIMGSSFKTSALTTFLSLAFWTWLWGPVGTLLAIPLHVIVMAILSHLLPDDEVELPE